MPHILLKPVLRTLRRALLSLFAAIAGLLPMAGNAAAEPALWVLRDGKATVYLFGTIHVLKAATDWQSPRITAALHASDALWLELPEGGRAELTQAVLWKLGKDPAHPLSTKLAPEDRQRLRDAAARAGIPPVSLESLRPWLAAILLATAPIQRAGYDSSLGVDNQLLAAARAADKPIRGLETAEQQALVFATLPAEMELALLLEAIAQQSSSPDLLDQMAGAWLAGDVDKLAVVLDAAQQGAEGRAFHERLFTRRNADWADQIAGLMRSGGTHFIAVGAGHLAGADSLQVMLSQRGFTVARY